MGIKPRRRTGQDARVSAYHHVAHVGGRGANQRYARAGLRFCTANDPFGTGARFTRTPGLRAKATQAIVCS